MQQLLHAVNLQLNVSQHFPVFRQALPCADHSHPPSVQVLRTLPHRLRLLALGVLHLLEALPEVIPKLLPVLFQTHEGLQVLLHGCPLPLRPLLLPLPPALHIRGGGGHVRQHEALVPLTPTLPASCWHGTACVDELVGLCNAVTQVQGGLLALQWQQGTCHQHRCRLDTTHARHAASQQLPHLLHLQRVERSPGSPCLPAHVG
eukprot:764581-Hanusia_phi.AAC.2